MCIMVQGWIMQFHFLIRAGLRIHDGRVVVVPIKVKTVNYIGNGDRAAVLGIRRYSAAVAILLKTTIIFHIQLRHIYNTESIVPGGVRRCPVQSYLLPSSRRARIACFLEDPPPARMARMRYEERRVRSFPIVGHIQPSGTPPLP
jgi:hypothetical protein